MNTHIPRWALGLCAPKFKRWIVLTTSLAVCLIFLRYIGFDIQYQPTPGLRDAVSRYPAESKLTKNQTNGNVGPITPFTVRRTAKQQTTQRHLQTKQRVLQTTKKHAMKPTLSVQSLENLKSLHKKVFFKAGAIKDDHIQTSKGSMKNITKPLHYKFNGTKQNDTFCGHNNMFCKDKVLILTPIRNSYNHLDHYAKLVQSLNYPHHLISIALGEDSSTDNTKKKAMEIVRGKFAMFRRASVFSFSHASHEDASVHKDWVSKHKQENQFRRREHMAKSRNNLLLKALQDEDWVLWIDCDVGWFPQNIIQGLIYAKKQVVVPSCMYKKVDGTTSVYDRNTWRETQQSLQYQNQISSKKLVLEGYEENSRRLFLPQLKSEGEVVPIDGVGGCVLLIRADLHRNGLIFPAFVFDHHIETEGLAKMAAAMGVRPYGMPWIEVIHS